MSVRSEARMEARLMSIRYGVTCSRQTLLYAGARLSASTDFIRMYSVEAASPARSSRPARALRLSAVYCRDVVPASVRTSIGEEKSSVAENCSVFAVAFTGVCTRPSLVVSLELSVQ